MTEVLEKKSVDKDSWYSHKWIAVTAESSSVEFVHEDGEQAETGLDPSCKL